MTRAITSSTRHYALAQALCVASTLGIAACSSDGNETGSSDGVDTPQNKTMSEDELLRAYLQYSGFDTTHFSINHDLGLVTFNDDAAVMLDDVREQLYTQKGYDAFGFTANFNTPSGPVTPYTIKKVHSSVVGDIKLIFETPQTHWWATEPVNDFWKASFRNAAQQWSSAGSKIRISESNGGGGIGATISIMMTTRTFCDKNGDGRNDCLAMAAWPGFGHPGHYVLVDPSKTPSCGGSGWLPPGCVGGGCFVRLIHLALHELGHTIGFAHPGCGNQIAGTATSPTCQPSVAPFSAYSTQMVTPFNCSDNGLLKSDDTTSIRLTYP